MPRRIAERQRLVSEIAAWEQQRNAARAHVNWMFTTEHACTKMGPRLPVPAQLNP